MTEHTRSKSVFVPQGLLYISGVILIGIIAVLYFGSPQWCRFIYLFQDRVIDGANRPHGYTGVWIEWYNIRQKSKEQSYKNGKLHGRCTHWFDNGQKSFQGDYEHGKPVGVQRGWYRDGQKYVETHIEGTQTFWHSNGQKMMEGKLKNGKADGIWREWDYDGKEIYRRYYDCGEIVRTEKLDIKSLERMRESTAPLNSHVRHTIMQKEVTQMWMKPSDFCLGLCWLSCFFTPFSSECA